MDKFYITPDVTISEILDKYPELEDYLFERFSSLNKVSDAQLKKMIAKVTKLSTLAGQDKINIETIINELRSKTGETSFNSENSDKNMSKPTWILEEKIVKTFNAVTIIQNGGHPLADVINDTDKLIKGEIYVLITPFVPAPLIDRVEANGFQSWQEQRADGLFQTYFIKL